jgi:hypothetical protein
MTRFPFIRVWTRALLVDARGVGVSTVAYEASSYADIDVLDPEGNRDVWVLDRVQLDHGWEAHDGAGWYLHLDEYPEEGSVGAFATRRQKNAP